jgi:serine phosphatase RsbU (regulator of sigma subunit)
VATLKVISGANAGHCYEVTGDEAVIGRYPFCDIVLPSHSVSRQHARIMRESDGYYIEDLNSLNGTFVNGQRVGVRARLHDQDEIHIYETILCFQDGSHVEIGPTVAGDHAPPGTAGQPARETQAPTREMQIVGAMDALAEPRLDVGAEAKLRAVLEITRHLGRSSAVDEFLPKILDSLFEIFPQAERGYVLLADKAGGPLSLRAAKQRRGETGNALTLGPISRSVAQRVMTDGEGILSNTASLDAAASALDDADTHSQMSVPLTGPSGRPLGIIHVDTVDASRRFSESDLDVLVSVATVAGQAVEHARAYEASLRFDRRERELATAREVQLHFLPQAAPVLPGYRFFEYYQAADDVGGDYFGYIPLNDGSLAIAMGDVSGKGMSAALLMARLCSEVRFCVATTSSPEEAMLRLNRELSDPLLDDRFVTFLLVVLDPRQHCLTVVSAGHMPPILRSAATGEVRHVGQAEAGPPLGFDNQWTYASASVPLEPGDAVVMYTDGIREATNKDDEIFGTLRICEVVAAAASEPAALGRQMLEAVKQFVAGRPQSDDICLLCFGRDPRSE